MCFPQLAQFVLRLLVRPEEVMFRLQVSKELLVPLTQCLHLLRQIHQRVLQTLLLTHQVLLF